MRKEREGEPGEPWPKRTHGNSSVIDLSSTVRTRCPWAYVKHRTDVSLLSLLMFDNYRDCLSLERVEILRNYGSGMQPDKPVPVVLDAKCLPSPLP